MLVFTLHDLELLEISIWPSSQEPLNMDFPVQNHHVWMIFWAPPYLLFPKFPASQLVAASRCLVEPTQASTCKKCIDQSACQSTAATILTSTWLRYTLFFRFGDVHNKKVSKSNLTSLRVSMPSVDDNHWKSMKQNIGETSAPKKPTASHRLWLHEPKLSVIFTPAIGFSLAALVFKTEEYMLNTSCIRWNGVRLIAKHRMSADMLCSSLFTHPTVTYEDQVNMAGTLQKVIRWKIWH